MADPSFLVRQVAIPYVDTDWEQWILAAQSRADTVSRETARLFNQINGQTIIEVGSGIHGRLAGDSVLTWAKRTRAKRIIAVDLDETRIREVKEATSQYPNVEAIVAEGVRFLADFSSTIELL